ncbi:GNAT family N-acetyltransferase [Actinoallomurus rhizosphaericola]|uniref:GNAT family N-acetyltransferase n=1 Tax=Actinoallomurus rhizosphaericola TaxID=2952536 RepID=UPI002090F74C|nr:GNAT family N-acetyltransferase [Actinoallomurus rhizosphaericola]MCO5993024.1 GNAT family N-acetyltransferase [Actinoallomurus rhizosphaericola]
MDKVQRLRDVSDADVAAWHEVVAAAVAHDYPGEPAPTLDQVHGHLATPGLGSRHLLWVARAEGAVTGVARLRLFEGAGRRHLGELTLHVHPEHRRRGVGTALLRTVARAARDEQRRTLVVEASSQTPGTSFLEANGFICALSLSLLLLDVAAAPGVEEIVGTEHPGYHLTRWLGVVPDELAEAFAEAKSAMGDMPTGKRDFGTTTWDTDRVRDMAEVVEKRGDTLLTVAALNGDRVAGFTELVIPVGDGTRAIQYDTAVVSAHRGRGLGLWVKAAMLEWLRAEWPAVREIETDNAEDNAHMLAVNERLGFRPLRQTRQYQCDPRMIH